MRVACEPLLNTAEDAGLTAPLHFFIYVGASRPPVVALQIRYASLFEL
jgi:hypothetical protein